jgi:hypothetical protein
MIVGNNILENRDLTIKERALLYYLMTHCRGKHYRVLRYKDIAKYLDYKNKHFGTVKKSIIKRLNTLQKYGYIKVNTNYIYKFRVALNAPLLSNFTPDKFSVKSNYITIPENLLNSVNGKYIPILASLYYYNTYILGSEPFKYIWCAKFSGCTKKTLHEYINNLIELNILEESPVGVKQGGYLIK